jgi:hypothetical protein
MLTNPFFGCENDEFFPDGIKNRYFIFAIFESKNIRRKIEFLHVAKVRLFE